MKDYAVYTDKIRIYTEEMPLEEAVDRAIRECIREGVLKEFLEAHRSEAKEMSIFEYDQEKHMRQEREAAWEEGHRTGLAEGKEQMLQKLIRRKLEKGWDAARIVSELEESEELVDKIIKKINEED